MATTWAAGRGRPPVSSNRTSRPYLPGSRGAGTTIVIACASVLTRRATTLIDRGGAGTVGRGGAVAAVAEPVRSATASRTPGPDGGGGSRVPATASESSARV